MGVESVSMKDFAERMGVTPAAISKAVRIGRLKRSIGRDANHRPFIRDYDLACMEWRDNSSRPVQSAEMASEPPASPPSADVCTEPDAAASVEMTLTEAQRDAAVERARKLKMENDLRAGELVLAADASREGFEFARTLRENILNLPARLSAELAAESDARRVFTRLDNALREALHATVAVLEKQEVADGVDGSTTTSRD